MQHPVPGRPASASNSRSDPHAAAENTEVAWTSRAHNLIHAGKAVLISTTARPTRTSRKTKLHRHNPASRPREPEHCAACARTAAWDAASSRAWHLAAAADPPGSVVVDIGVIES